MDCLSLIYIIAPQEDTFFFFDKIHYTGHEVRKASDLLALLVLIYETKNFIL